MKAVWNNQVIAQSDDTLVVEGNHYFPLDALDSAFFRENTHTSVCPWKGTANYFDVIVAGETNSNAAWIYRQPHAAAAEIRDRVAFWRGVQVVD